MDYSYNIRMKTINHNYFFDYDCSNNNKKGNLRRNTRLFPLATGITFEDAKRLVETMEEK